MNVTVRHLRAFVLVARHRSFAVAAERLAVSPPSVSGIIRQLEVAVGGRLLQRTTRHVALTAEGESVLQRAEDAVRAFDGALEALDAVVRSRTEHLRLVVLPSISSQVLPPILAQFALIMPRVRIHVRDGNASDVARRVAAGEDEIGIANRIDGAVDLDFLPLLQDRFGLVCRRDSPLGAGTGSISWRELEGIPFLALASDTGIRPLIDAVPGLPNSIGNARHQISNIASMAALLNGGLGITALPRLAFPAFHPELVFRELIDPPLSREIGVLSIRGQQLSKPALKVINLLLSIFRKNDI